MPTNSLKCSIMVAALLVVIGAARAQDEAPAKVETPTKAETPAAAVAREWKELRVTEHDHEAAAPQEAIDAYIQFYEDKGYRSGDVALEIVSRVAQLYYRGLGQRDKALSIYDWGVEEWKRHPRIAVLQREREALLQPGVSPVAPIRPGVAAPKAGSAPAIPPTVQFPTSAPMADAIPKIVAPNASSHAFAPQVVAPVVMQPVVVPRVELAGIGGSSKAAALVAQLGAGVDAETLWQSGTYKADDLIYALSAPNAIADGEAGKKSRLALAGLLAKHAPEKLEATEDMNRRMRLALAEYYASEKDERAVALYEGLLKELLDQSQPRAVEVDELRGLADYYESIGQKSKAAATLARAPEYSTLPFMVSESAAKAARLYREAGEGEKAQEQYEKAAGSSLPWMKGMAIWDQAYALMKQGKNEEARKLLKTPLEGQNADQVRVLLLSALAYSYYRSGDLKEARKQSEASVAQYQSLVAPMPNEGLEGAVSNAQMMLTWLERWEKEPARIVVDPTQIELYVEPGAANGNAVSYQVAVRSLSPNRANVISNDARLRVKAFKLDSSDAGFFYQTIYDVEVAPEARGQSFETKLQVSDTLHPQWKVEVPVMFEVRAAKQDQ